ncbi:Helix-turn-helix [Variovorax sp. PDC80]|uniref:helix-turn-helix domain-containing protein n=1 Tax=Variovorax sp. PDC80 TaxID=1882827 RepID=UPI0008EC58B4|nr:helix-turn-helix domain-containing protein [Variovorax sp. PDC80]SFO30642.1 Helix-turn-helix [Variovorax sp. PDC80]
MKPQELVLALRAMGLTQKQIQKRTGIPQPTISKIGRYGERDVMLRTYDALLAAYEQQLKEGPVAPGPGRGRPLSRSAPVENAASESTPATPASASAPAPTPARSGSSSRRRPAAPVVLRPFPRGPLPWPAMHRD